MGFLLLFLVFAEDLVEHAESSFLLLGLTVLRGERPSRLCSRETGKNKNARRGQEMGGKNDMTPPSPSTCFIS
ncbi:rCG44728 [Rattus norvegicus]|uniref:RCG44728 n=1 Tax=Rattus norvegicus TaxID=10116 RepID=A6I5N9_RAT|nr:rCG44728 [Rattus norvegicus]